MPTDDPVTGRRARHAPAGLSENSGSLAVAQGGVGDLIEQLTSEGLISMRDAAALYGRRTHKSTPTRHALNGVKLPNGRRVKLEAIRVAGALCTSKAAVLRFFAAQNDATGTSTSSTPTPAQHSRAAKRASQEAATIFQKK